MVPSEEARSSSPIVVTTPRSSTRTGTTDT